MSERLQTINVVGGETNRVEPMNDNVAVDCGRFQIVSFGVQFLYCCALFLVFISFVVGESGVFKQKGGFLPKYSVLQIGSDQC